jgi:YD repeat-containing protein
VWRRSIVVHNVPSKTRLDALKMLLETEDEGGGQITEFVYDESGRKAFFTFRDAAGKKTVRLLVLL